MTKMNPKLEFLAQKHPKIIPVVFSSILAVRYTPTLFKGGTYEMYDHHRVSDAQNGPEIRIPCPKTPESHTDYVFIHFGSKLHPSTLFVGIVRGG